MKLRLGISTCPNDVFTFCGIITRNIDLLGLDVELQFLDVQELNCLLATDSLDCSKASIHAALRLAENYGLLVSGSAIGVGVGPLVLAREPGRTPAPDSRVACPGEWTTAALLFRCCFPLCRNIDHCVFSEIMPRLQRSTADFGVVIHEGRFTFQHEGLTMVTDLGDWWQLQTGAPLPLGGILARKRLGPDVHRRLVKIIQSSLQYAQQNREIAFALMREYAQELSPEVIWSHVNLYVNEFTHDVGVNGEKAIEALRRMAMHAGVLSTSAAGIEMLGM